MHEKPDREFWIDLVLFVVLCSFFLVLLLVGKEELRYVYAFNGPLVLAGYLFGKVHYLRMNVERRLRDLEAGMPRSSQDVETAA